MVKKKQFIIKHIIAKTSKEERELHMKQAFAALLKMVNKDGPPTSKM